MEPERNEQPASQATTGRQVGVIAPAHGDDPEAPPTEETPSCPTCGAGATAMPPSYIYAFGKAEARFPTPGVEKEFAQVAGQAETAGKTDQQVFHAVLSKPENRYLVRHMCWVLTIQGLETYILLPRDPVSLSLLVDAIDPASGPEGISIVVGVRGPIAPPELCNGLMVPVVAFDQIYSFRRKDLIEAIPRPEKTTKEQFGAAARDVLDRILQMTDNTGEGDDARALNYLAGRYSAIYAKAAEEFARDFSLTAVETRPSPLSATRRIVKATFVYTNRKSAFSEKFCVAVDVTDEWPFLVAPLSPCYDH